MAEISIRGRKVSLTKLFGEEFLAKFSFPVPPSFEQSCSHAILFTDIIGSSQIYHDKGDHHGLILASQKYEIAATISSTEPFLGHIKIIKSMGDALFIICEDALIAYTFVTALIQELRECSGRIGQQIRIRSTLHYGSFIVYQPRFQTGKDCFGEAINNTARLEGENKNLVKQHHNGDDWAEYPLLLSGDFFSELQKKLDLPDEKIEMHTVRIREYHDKDIIAYLVRT